MMPKNLTKEYLEGADLDTLVRTFSIRTFAHVVAWMVGMFAILFVFTAIGGGKYGAAAVNVLLAGYLLFWCQASRYVIKQLEEELTKRNGE